MDLLCNLHERQNAGKLTANLKQIARACRCSEPDMHVALEELRNTGTADVYERDGFWTIVCRRMKKAAELQAKRKESGSKGGSKTQANREHTPHEREEEEKERCTKEREEEENVPTLFKDVRTEEERANVRVHSALERVRAFAQEKGISESDADWFFWKGEGNGWTNGGRPILDWKATLLSWHRGRYLPSQKQRQNMVSKSQGVPAYTRVEREVREPSDEEFKKAGDVAREALEKFRKQEL